MVDQLFAGTRLAAQQYGGVCACNLSNLLIDLAQRPGVADDMAEVIAFAQFLLEVGVFVDQTLLVSLEQMSDFDRLRNHRGDDRQKIGGAFVVAVHFVFQIDAEHAVRFSVNEDGYTDKTKFLSLQRLLPRFEAIQEQGLPTHLRDNYWFTGFGDASRDSFTNFIS